MQDYRALSPLELLAMVEEAGICGHGGVGFPTTEKLRHSIDRGIDEGIELLIINAVECEPYITADEALIRERLRLCAALTPGVISGLGRQPSQLAGPFWHRLEEPES